MSLKSLSVEKGDRQPHNRKVFAPRGGGFDTSMKDDMMTLIPFPPSFRSPLKSNETGASQEDRKRVWSLFMERYFKEKKKNLCVCSGMFILFI